MEVHGRTLIECTYEHASCDNSCAPRNLSRAVAKDALESNEDLAFAAIVVCVGGRIRIAFEKRRWGERPDLGVDGPSVLIHAVLKDDRGRS